MTDSPFHQRLRAAIEARESLATEPVELDLDADDKQEWQRQRQLDEAIAAWKRISPGNPARAARRARSSAGMVTSAALGLGIVGAIVTIGTHSQPARGPLAMSTMPAAFPTNPAPAPISNDLAQSVPSSVPTAMPREEIASHPAVSGDNAELIETADRFAYAIEPVGRRVSDVVQHLIDAVPGGDVLAATWSYDS